MTRWFSSSNLQPKVNHGRFYQCFYKLYCHYSIFHSINYMYLCIKPCLVGSPYKETLNVLKLEMEGIFGRGLGIFFKIIAFKMPFKLFCTYKFNKIEAIILSSSSYCINFHLYGYIYLLLCNR